MSTLSSQQGYQSPGSSQGSRTITVLGELMKVKGQVFSAEDLTIEGQVEGTVEAGEGRVTVGPKGTVTASVKAREVSVLGTITGDVEADKVDIGKDATLVGNIRTARLTIDDGAYFKGNIDIVPRSVPR